MVMMYNANMNHARCLALNIMENPLFNSMCQDRNNNPNHNPNDHHASTHSSTPSNSDGYGGSKYTLAKLHEPVLTKATSHFQQSRDGITPPHSHAAWNHYTCS